MKKQSFTTYFIFLLAVILLFLQTTEQDFIRQDCFSAAQTQLATDEAFCWQEGDDYACLSVSYNKKQRIPLISEKKDLFVFRQIRDTSKENFSIHKYVSISHAVLCVYRI